jgi:hypothetical protein
MYTDSIPSMAAINTAIIPGRTSVPAVITAIVPGIAAVLIPPSF